MRGLITALLMMGASAGLTLVLLKEKGYFLLGYGVWTVEGSLAFFVLVVAMLFVLTYLSIRLFIWLFSAPSGLSHWNRRRRRERAQRSFHQGLRQLAEGNWASAERQLLRHLSDAPMPTLNYLAAARSAHAQREIKRRDQYLRQAMEADDSAEMAVGLTLAELQLQQSNLDQAQETLGQLNKLNAQHPPLMLLMRSLYRGLGDWRALLDILPALRQQKLLDDSESQTLELEARRQVLSQILADGTESKLNAFWDATGKSLRSDSQLLGPYAERIGQLGRSGEAEELLRTSLNQHWDERLVGHYAGLTAGDPLVRLTHAEKWLGQRPHDPALLLALGRLSLQGRLWGKARSYLEASLGVKPSVEAYHELGRLLEQLEESEAATQCYRRGLELATGAAVEVMAEGAAPEPGEVPA